jgi:hypothetical protein
MGDPALGIHDGAADLLGTLEIRIGSVEPSDVGWQERYAMPGRPEMVGEFMTGHTGL